jgi:hypothetical protein
MRARPRIRCTLRCGAASHDCRPCEGGGRVIVSSLVDDGQGDFRRLDRDFTFVLNVEIHAGE